MRLSFAQLSCLGSGHNSHIIAGRYEIVILLCGFVVLALKTLFMMFMFL